MSIALTESVPVQGTRVETWIVDPTETDGWDRWLESFPDATPFHTAAWAAVLKRSYRHVPLYLMEQSIAPDETASGVERQLTPSHLECGHSLGAIAADVSSRAHLEKRADDRWQMRSQRSTIEKKRCATQLPSPSLSAIRYPFSVLPLMEIRSPITGRRGVCLPFTDFCPPLPSTLAALPSPLSALARSRRWRSIELRGGSAPAPNAIPSQAFYRHTLDLTDDLETLFEGCDPATRRAVRKAEQAGLDVELAHTMGALHEFYALHVRTRRKHGLPPQPFAFFLAIHDEIISRGHGFITVARRALQPIAAALFLHFGRNAIYKFGASDDTQLDLRGNNLVMWQSIRWLGRNGFDTLDFGRTATSQDGLRRFKLGWGTREQLLHYYRYCLRTNRYLTVPNRAIGRHNAWFGRLPLTVNRVLGRLLYPHLD